MEDRPCHDCLHNERVLVAAQYTAPIRRGNAFTWIAVCSDHANGWYDGADFDETDAPIYAVEGE